MAKRKKWQFKTGEDVAAAMERRPPAVRKAAPVYPTAGEVTARALAKVGGAKPEGPAVRLVIPRWRPMLANEWAGNHWSVLERGKKEAANFVGTYAMAAGLKLARWDFRVVRRVAVELVLPDGRVPPDADAMFKVLLDGMKRCRVLVDDSPAFCKWTPPTYRRGAELATILTITDIEVGPPVNPDDDPDVKRMLTLLTKRIARKNRDKPKQNAPLAPVPVGKRGLPRVG